MLTEVAATSPPTWHVAIRVLGMTFALPIEPAELHGPRIDLIVAQQDGEKLTFEVRRGTTVPYAPQVPERGDGWRAVAEVYVPAGALQIDDVLVRRIHGEWA